MIHLHHGDNKAYMETLIRDTGICFDTIYADMMYDELDFSWVRLALTLLKDTGSIFIQTDYRSVAQLKIYLDTFLGKECFVNWIVWSYDWGGRSQRSFGRKHDDILWYSRFPNQYKFYPEKVLIPKKVTGAKMNPSGREGKIPTDVWEGNFHTMSKERVVDPETGSGFRWQKPLWITDRIITATTEPGDVVFDPFLGSGSTGVSAYNAGCDFYGVEVRPEVFQLAKERLIDLAGTIMFSQGDRNESRKSAR